MATVCSAAATTLPVGALTTMTPACVAASTSMLSTPTPARATTRSRVPARMTSAVTCVALRTSKASYWGIISSSLSGASPVSTSTSTLGAARRAASPTSDRLSLTRIRWFSAIGLQLHFGVH